MRDLWNQIRQLWKEIGIVRQVLERINVQWRMPMPAYYFVTIDGGNTLDSGQSGVIYVEGEIPSVPSAYDPNVTSTFIDGIGRGKLYINGAAQDGYVLVVNDDRGINRNAVLAGENPYTGSFVMIPVAASSVTVVAYVIC